jgi:hypothetical protein
MPVINRWKPLTIAGIFTLVTMDKLRSSSWFQAASGGGGPRKKPMVQPYFTGEKMDASRL